MVLEPKKDGTVRFCVDNRNLNAMRLRDAYSIPRMDESIDSLGGAKVFSTLYTSSEYWQILIAPNDREKTVLATHFETIASTSIPFGLENTPETYEQAIDTIVTTSRW